MTGHRTRAAANGVGKVTQHTLDRLAREKPKLFERVKQGSLSANAAAIKAGFRS